MSKILYNLSRFEKIVIVFLTALIILTSSHLTWIFYIDNTEVLPAEGGIYAEGLIGELRLINPVFANQNPIDADICKLVFAGLMKFDATQNTIVDDIAIHTLSLDKKTYTFTVRENAYFHDGEPVTADDIMFTFKDVIQNPDFKNEMLKRDFEGIEIQKIDARTVTFTLPKPYKFFLTNLTIGLLPKHLLFDLPIENLDQSSFNQNPIGAGPYKFTQILVNNNSRDVNLKKFDKYYGESPKITGMVMKIYPNYNTLIKDLDVLNGVRNIPKDQVENFPIQNRFELNSYHLPQYVALFLNTNSNVLKDKNIRLALQLATDRQEIIDNFSEDLIIDDPLMEKDDQNWIYQYDPEKANGALFDAEWKFPKKEEDIKKTEVETSTGVTAILPLQKNKSWFIPSALADDTKYIYSPNQGENLETKEKTLFILGRAPADAKNIMVNNYTLSKFGSGSTTWSYKASTEIGTLRLGENIYEIFSLNSAGEKTKIDEMIITLIEGEPTIEEIVPVVETVVVPEPAPEPIPVIEKEVVIVEETGSELTEDLTSSGTEIEEEIIDIEKPKAPIVEVKKPIKTSEPIRKNSDGENLKLRLITSKTPVFYSEIANEIQKKWLAIGVETELEVLDMSDFQKRVRERDYDVLLYGQSLGYNLDAYPYWHSSQIEEKGLNLSNYASFEADSLMEEIRQTHDLDRREILLNKLAEVMREDVVAIFLYRPVYYLAYDKRLKNIEVNDLLTISDRFASVENWYLKEERFFAEGMGWGNFWSWIAEKSIKF